MARRHISHRDVADLGKPVGVYAMSATRYGNDVCSDGMHDVLGHGIARVFDHDTVAGIDKNSST